MTIVLAALGAAFVVIAIWLTVRIVNRRERWAKLTAAVMIFLTLVGYPLSIGPACSIAAFPQISNSALDYRPSGWMCVYWPLGWVAHKASPIGQLLVRYIQFWMPEETLIAIPISSDASIFFFFSK